MFFKKKKNMICSYYCHSQQIPYKLIHIEKELCFRRSQFASVKVRGMRDIKPSKIRKATREFLMQRGGLLQNFTARLYIK
jgi:hypothetical protein